MFVGGIIVLATGKIWLGKTYSGVGARVAGSIMVLTLPLAFAVGLLLGLSLAPRGARFNPDDQQGFILIDVFVVALCFALAAIVAITLGEPVHAPVKRRRREQSYDADRLWPEVEPARPALPVSQPVVEPARRVAPPVLPLPPDTGETGLPALPASTGRRPARSEEPGRQPRGGNGWVIGGIVGVSLLGLAGVGVVLWAALSRREPTPPPPVAMAQPDQPAPIENDVWARRDEEERRRLAEAREQLERAEVQMRQLEAREKQARAEGREQLERAEAQIRQLEAREKQIRAEEREKQAKAEEREKQIRAEEREKQARAEALEKQARAEEQKRLAGVAERARQDADGARRDAEAARREVEAARREAGPTRREVDRLNYLHQVTSAERSWRANQMARASDLLDACRPELRGWEWHYLRRQCQGGLLSIDTDDVDRVFFSSDGRLLGTVHLHGRAVRVWDARTGQEVFTLPHKDQVHGAAFSPDGKYLAVCDGRVRLWDVKTQTAVGDLVAQNWSGDVVFSPDGKQLAASNALTAGDVKVWDVAERKEVFSWNGGKHRPRRLVYHPDGKRLISVGLLTQNDVFVLEPGAGKDARPFPGCSLQVAFSPDGNRVATVVNSKTVRVQNVQTGQVLATLSGHTSGITGLAWHPDGNLLASSSFDRSVRVWDTTAGKEVAVNLGHRDRVLSVAFSPDGRQLVSGGLYFPNESKPGITRGDLKMWPVGASQEALSVNTRGGAVLGLAWSPDGKRVATIESDRTVNVLDSLTCKTLTTLRGHTETPRSVAWSPDGKRLATSASTSTNVAKPGELKVWDVEAAREVLQLTGHTLATSGLAWNADGTRLASAGQKAREGNQPERGEVVIWNAADGKLVSRADETYEVSDVVTDAKSECVFVAGGNVLGGEIKSLDPRTGAPVAKVAGRDRGVRKLAVSPQGLRVAMIDHKGIVHVLDWPSGKEVFVLRGHDGPATAVAFAPDGRRLATGGIDAAVVIWDLDSGKEALVLRGHPGPVAALAFGPDGSRLASAGNRNTVGQGEVRIWDGTLVAREAPAPPK
jgi:WD40 repeat protein